MKKTSKILIATLLIVGAVATMFTGCSANKTNDDGGNVNVPVIGTPTVNVNDYIVVEEANKHGYLEIYNAYVDIPAIVRDYGSRADVEDAEAEFKGRLPWFYERTFLETGGKPDNWFSMQPGDTVEYVWTVDECAEGIAELEEIFDVDLVFENYIYTMKGVDAE